MFALYMRSISSICLSLCWVYAFLCWVCLLSDCPQLNLPWGWSWPAMRCDAISGLVIFSSASIEPTISYDIANALSEFHEWTKSMAKSWSCWVCLQLKCIHVASTLFYYLILLALQYFLFLFYLLIIKISDFYLQRINS